MQYQLSTKASRTHRFPDAPDAIPLLNFVNGGSRKKKLHSNSIFFSNS